MMAVTSGWEEWGRHLGYLEQLQPPMSGESSLVIAELTRGPQTSRDIVTPGCLTSVFMGLRHLIGEWIESY